MSAVLGKHYTRLDKICDVDEVAAILTLRAAEQGIYRVYNRKAVSKAVRAGKIAAVPEEELPEPMRGWQKKFYLRDDASNMEFIPTKGRKPPSVEEYRKRLGDLIELAKTEHVEDGVINRARMMLELSADAERVVKEVQEEQRSINEEKARRAKEQEEAEAYGAFLYTAKEHG